MRDVFTKPSISDSAVGLDLWRERPFAVHIDDRLIQGVFDRVVVFIRDRRAVRADLIHFKSDVISREQLPHRAEHYRPQLEPYRTALSALLKIAPSDIHARLLFIEPGEYFDL